MKKVIKPQNNYDKKDVCKSFYVKELKKTYTCMCICYSELTNNEYF